MNQKLKNLLEAATNEANDCPDSDSHKIAVSLLNIQTADDMGSLALTALAASGMECNRLWKLREDLHRQ